MDIRDPEYRGMAKLALDRKDEILALRAENKQLREVIESALRISDLWTLKEVETMFEDEAKALEIMKTGFEQALKAKENEL